LRQPSATGTAVKLDALKAPSFPDRNETRFIALPDVSPKGGAIGALPVSRKGEAYNLMGVIVVLCII